MPIIIRSSSYPVKYSCAMYFHGKVDLMQSCLIFQIILYHRVTTYYVQRNFMGEWLSEIAGPYYRNLGGGRVTNQKYCCIECTDIRMLTRKY